MFASHKDLLRDWQSFEGCDGRYFSTSRTKDSNIGDEFPLGSSAEATEYIPFQEDSWISTGL